MSISMAAAVLLVAYLGPAVAEGRGTSAAQEAQMENSMEAMQGEAVQAGTTDVARVSYFNTMKPERQAAWHEHCTLTASDKSEAKKDSDEMQSFCQAIPAK
jgi:hypothetical protein